MAHTDRAFTRACNHACEGLSSQELLLDDAHKFGKVKSISAVDVDALDELLALGEGEVGREHDAQRQLHSALLLYC